MEKNFEVDNELAAFYILECLFKKGLINEETMKRIQLKKEKYIKTKIKGGK